MPPPKGQQPAKNQKGNNKKSTQNKPAKTAAAGTLDVLDSLLDARSKKAPTKAAKSDKAPLTTKQKIGVSTKASTVKEYNQIIASVTADEIDEQTRREQENKAKRMDEGEVIDTQKALKDTKRDRKISEQLNKTYDEAIKEEAVITSRAKVAEVKEDAEVAGEQDCLRIEPFDLSFKGNLLFKETQITLATGHRYGLVGPNGCGKSTFLRNLANKKLPGILLFIIYDFLFFFQFVPFKL